MLDTLMSDSPDMPERPLGLDAFDPLAAEYETAWLHRAYVLPTNFSAMMGNTSVMVFGETGSGKTALKQSLEFHALQPARPPLIANWRPQLQTSEGGSPITVNGLMVDLLRVCAQSVLRHLTAHTEQLTNLSRFAQVVIRDLVRTYLANQLERELLRLEEDVAADNVQRVAEFLVAPALSGASASTPLTEIAVMNELTIALKRMELSGIWLMIDDIQPLLDISDNAIQTAMRLLFSVLRLFENPEFVFKIFLPLELERVVTNTNAPQRRRIVPYRLRWSEAQLMEIVRCRLAVATGQPDFGLQALSDTVSWAKKLTAESGRLPRGGLAVVRPYLERYLSQESSRELDLDEVTQIEQQSLPLLRVDLDTGSVFVGFREITNLQDIERRILRFLYAQGSASREELYYRVYLGLDKVLLPADKGYRFPKDYAGTLDTIIWRIRQSIEPTAYKQPRYLITQRGRGFVLTNLA
jgi:hypothetical protein